MNEFQLWNGIKTKNSLENKNTSGNKNYYEVFSETPYQPYLSVCLSTFRNLMCAHGFIGNFMEF
jgi:hypothetical protein